MPRTPPLVFVTAFCYGSLLRSSVPLRYSWKYVGVRPFKYGREELAVVDLIAEREGIQPQQRKKFLDAFGALAFAIAPLHSTFIG